MQATSRERLTSFQTGDTVIVPSLGDRFGTEVQIEITGHLFSGSSPKVSLIQSVFERLFGGVEPPSRHLPLKTLDVEIVQTNEFWQQRGFELGMQLKLVHDSSDVWRISGARLPNFVLDLERGTFDCYR